MWIPKVVSSPPEPADGAGVKIYVQNDILKIAWKDGSTVRITELALNSASTVWSQSNSSGGS